MARPWLVAFVILVAALLFVLAMAAFPALRIWIALLAVLLMNAAIVGAWLRAWRRPERYNPPPLFPSIVTIAFALFFYCLFLSQFSGAR